MFRVDLEAGRQELGHVVVLDILQALWSEINNNLKCILEMYLSVIVFLH